MKKESDIAEEIAKLIINFFNQDGEEKDTQKLHNDILALTYISLRQTCRLTVEMIKEIYDIEKDIDEQFSDSDIDEYTYNNDGLSLNKRIWKAIKKAQLKKTDEAQRSLLMFEIIRILDNETKVVSNKLTKKIIRKYTKIEYGYVASGNGCNRDCCNVEDNVEKPIDEIDQPPYHPNCNCFVVYVENELDDEEW